MPTLLICGDPHGDFSHIATHVQESPPDAVILLGDLELPLPAKDVFANIADRSQVWWIHGNHDTDRVEYYDNLFSSEFLECCLHGRVVDVCGLRIAGLGGVFRSKVWDGGPAYRFWSRADMVERCGKGNRWRNDVPLRHRSTIFPMDVESLVLERADILVTHEAPSLHPFGNAAVDRLATSLGVNYAFHGHHHDTISYTNSCWHGVGLRKTLLLDL